ncbi:hypothetical protein [Bradyrhizobium sp.]
MGAVDLDPTSEGASCMGLQTLIQLNEWFGNPHSEKFRQAKERNNFGKVSAGPGNYQELIDAYKYAGLNVNDAGWIAYLTRLGTVASPNLEQGPQNIFDIAQLRDKCLRNDVGVRTTIHKPTGPGRVSTDPPKGGDDQWTIDSPYPLPDQQ